MQAGAGLDVKAGHDIVLSAGVNQATVDEGHQQTSKGFLSSKTITTRDMLDRSGAEVSSFGGATLAMAAGNDIKLSGAQVLSDGAGRGQVRHPYTISALATSICGKFHFNKCRYGSTDCPARDVKSGGEVGHGLDVGIAEVVSEWRT